MTNSGDRTSRVRQYCDAILIAIELSKQMYHSYMYSTCMYMCKGKF